MTSPVLGDQPIDLDAIREDTRPALAALRADDDAMGTDNEARVMNAVAALAMEVRRLQAELQPAACVMTYTPPFDFAHCETHDQTFPLGGKCRFDGRQVWEVYAEEEHKQRVRAVGAEHRQELAEAEVERLGGELTKMIRTAADCSRVVADAVAERDRLQADNEMYRAGFRCVLACSCSSHCPPFDGQVECDPPCCVVAERDQLAAVLARWESGQRRKGWPVIESVPDGLDYAAQLARAQGTEGGDAHDRLLREAAVRLRDLHDVAGPLLAERDRAKAATAEIGEIATAAAKGPYGEFARQPVAELRRIAALAEYAALTEGGEQ